MSAPVKQEQSTAWELRRAWAEGHPVRVTLGPRCMLRMVVGRVTRVAVTGAWVMIDGWHVPTTEILGTGKPTLEDVKAYGEMLKERDL